jgi:signal transduction histidine kinase
MPYYASDGSMSGIISNVIDITEKREILLKLTNIIDDERRNISYELHDDLGQNLTAIGFIMESIRQKISNPPRWLLDKINETSELLVMAQNKTRSLSKILSPVDIGRDGLRVSLEIMARSMERVYDIKCDVSVDDGFEIDDNNTATILYYIAREASTNAVKHGKSKTISIRAFRDDSTRGIIIRDDGTGIGKTIADTGIGLKIMKYRAQIIGASFSMENYASGGLEVAVRLPY